MMEAGEVKRHPQRVRTNLLSSSQPKMRVAGLTKAEIHRSSPPEPFGREIRHHQKHGPANSLKTLARY
jgi:hypothetical protein